MRITLFVVLAAFLAASCSAGSNVNRGGTPTNIKSPPANSDSNTTSVPPPIAERKGERVAVDTEVDFRSGIPAGWEVIDPERSRPSGWETSGGSLRLRIPTGKDLFGENRTAPRLIKNVTGDFEIEATVKFDPRSDYQGAGLMIFRNDSNYVRLERGFGGVGGGESGVRFDRAEDESYDALATPEKFPTKANVVELRLRREGKVITAYWRPSGKSEWTKVGEVANTYPETVVVGLIGVNTGTAIEAEFSAVRLRPLASQTTTEK